MIEINTLKEFIIALCYGVLAHTLMGATKHKKTKDFDWKALLDGAIDFAMVLTVIILVVAGINEFKPLQVKFSEEMSALMETIVIGVYGKVVVLLAKYWGIKEEDIKIQNDYNEGNGLEK